MHNQRKEQLRTAAFKTALVVETAGSAACEAFALLGIAHASSEHLNMPMIWNLTMILVPFLIHISLNNLIKYSFSNKEKSEGDEKHIPIKQIARLVLSHAFLKPLSTEKWEPDE